MTKYEPLFRYLRDLDTRRWQASFTEIETLIGATLPPSARRYPAWWSNYSTKGRQSHAWLDAGFSTSSVNLTAEIVVFGRPQG